MKFVYLFLPFFLGILAVLQAGLNRSIAKTHSLFSVVLFNNGMVFGFSVLAWLCYRKFYVGDFKTPSLLTSTFQWWYFVPGVAGFLFVLLLPYSIARFGATRVFIMLILAQIISGITWDLYVENQSLSPSRYLAVLFSIFSCCIEFCLSDVLLFC